MNILGYVSHAGKYNPYRMVGSLLDIRTAENGSLYLPDCFVHSYKDGMFYIKSSVGTWFTLDDTDENKSLWSYDLDCSYKLYAILGDLEQIEITE